VTLDLDVHGLPASTADTFIINTEELLFYSMLSNLVRNAAESREYSWTSRCRK
jgi:hypothetical protein